MLWSELVNVESVSCLEKSITQQKDSLVLSTSKMRLQYASETEVMWVEISHYVVKLGFELWAGAIIFWRVWRVLILSSNLMPFDFWFNSHILWYIIILSLFVPWKFSRTNWTQGIERGLQTFWEVWSSCWQSNRLSYTSLQCDGIVINWYLLICLDV